jgi:hypothetical protein
MRSFTVFILTEIIRVIKSRRVKCAEQVVRMGRRETHMTSIGKREGKKPIRRPERGWQGNIKMDFKESGLDSCDSES